MSRYENIDLSKVDWHKVLTSMGVAPELIEKPKKRGPCPLCGGKSRFRFKNDTGRGEWVCNCGGGDGVRLVAKLLGVTDLKAIIEVKEAVNGSGMWRKAALAPPQTTKSPDAIAKARRDIATVYRGSRPVVDSPAMRYLRKRVNGLDMTAVSPEIRCHASLWHCDEGTGEKTRRPAMIVPARDLSVEGGGEIITLHRTYLTEQGEKAPVSSDQVKKMMTAVVNKMCGESAILNTAAAKDVAILTEGVEQGFAWVAATGNRFPVISAFNAYGMASFKWPAWAKRLVVIVDNDAPNPKTGLRAGLHAALTLRDRAMAAGIRVLLVMSPDVGVDFDVYWNEGMKEVFDFKRYLDQSAYEVKPAAVQSAPACV